MRNLIVVLGDQLSLHTNAWAGFHPGRDAVWMAEVEREAVGVWSHRQRLLLFFTAMRLFRNEIAERGWRIHYHQLTAERSRDRGSSFEELLTRDLPRLRPERIRLLQPGDHRVAREVARGAAAAGVPLQVLPDADFFDSPEEFNAWAEGRKSLVLEDYYRHLRRRERMLLDRSGKPLGGRWNFDRENRRSFGRRGPPAIPPAPAAPRDPLRREVEALLEARFRDHPGRLDAFAWPVSRPQALEHLAEFLAHRLSQFGPYQDALWSGEHQLFHSRLSASLNLHLLTPREVVEGALREWEEGRAPLNSVEGFIRQVLGWREFVRGIYWRYMPEYEEGNALECEDRPLPRVFWDGRTEMNCLRHAMENVLEHAYAHHIQRLMVLGLYALLLGVHPRRFHEWHMAMYADAVDWVSLPNTLGMSQYGDGGLMATKPYCATGAYLHRMSNHCRDCRFDPARAEGPEACPLTTLYWDFLERHRGRLRGNPRMRLQFKNLERKPPREVAAIVRQAAALREAAFAD